MLLGGEEAGRGIGQLGMGRLTSGRDAAHSGPSFGGGGGSQGTGLLRTLVWRGGWLGGGSRRQGRETCLRTGGRMFPARDLRLDHFIRVALCGPHIPRCRWLPTLVPPDAGGRCCVTTIKSGQGCRPLR